ncbi:hypothetical protein BH20ACT9_BH20ACT9_12490 [soil metagenome]
MPHVGGQELVFILVLALLFFGGKKLPELGSSVGHSIQNFKRSVAEGGGDTPSPRPEAGDDAPSPDAPVAGSPGTAERS